MIDFFKTIFLVFIVASYVQAQVCDGNLGENIFESGDFGSGEDNILQNDPNLAPGYMYTTQMPPQDGYYTISNNIDEWPNAFGWARIEDNSSDPDGYMMIVNASNEPGLFYNEIVEDLCDNTLYEFSLDIYNLINQGTNLILPNVSFLINGVEQFATGDVPENNIWTTYGFSFITEPGQTTVTLSLRNNAPGGQGNDIALDNISFRPCGDEALILPDNVENICNEEFPFTLSATVIGNVYDTPAYQWQQSFDMGETWENIMGANSAEYQLMEVGSEFNYYRYYLANGSENLGNQNCRIVSNVKVLQSVPKVFSFSDTICAGGEYRFGNTELTMGGIYVDSLVNEFGCDSIVTLTLEILSDTGISADFIVENPLCAEDESGSIAIENIINATDPFTITFNDDILSDSSIGNLPVGNYNFEIIDERGCTLDTIISLSPSVPLLLDIGDDRIITIGDNIVVEPDVNRDVVNYFWEPSDLFDCDAACSQLEYVPLSTTLIRLRVEDANGCTATDSLWVRVEEEAIEIFVPNVFSPNNDGNNDVFFIQSNEGDLPIRAFHVFDRWGNKVFSQLNFMANDPVYGWDGMFNNKKASSGVYVFLVEYEDNTSNTDGLYKGEVTLLR